MNTYPSNRIENLIKQKEIKGFRFLPDRSFYKEIGIKQRRFGLILRNDQPATTEELFKISKFFGFEYTELLIPEHSQEIQTS